MAEFCKQCSEELFGEDFADFAGICQEGGLAVVICEGCGLTHVNYLGECINPDCLEKHCKPKVGDACCAAIHTDYEYFFGTITAIEGDLAWSNLGSKFLVEEFCGDLPTRKENGVWVFDSF